MLVGAGGRGGLGRRGRRCWRRSRRGWRMRRFLRGRLSCAAGIRVGSPGFRYMASLRGHMKRSRLSKWMIRHRRFEWLLRSYGNGCIFLLTELQSRCSSQKGRKLAEMSRPSRIDCQKRRCRWRQLSLCQRNPHLEISDESQDSRPGVIPTLASSTGTVRATKMVAF